MNFAVIGAGLAGLTCANVLRQAGATVTVLDKARGPGGRMASRHTDAGTFDLGAQFFTARDQAFVAQVDAWCDDGVVAQWEPANPPRDDRWYVGVPRMSALTRHLSADLDLRTSIRIRELAKDDSGWRLLGEGGHDLGVFDAVLVAIPAPQAIELLQPVAPQLVGPLGDEVIMQPCWAVTAAFDERIEFDRDAAFIDDSPLGWIARDSSKPGREPGERWVLHAAHDWSAEHLEDDADTVRDALLAAFAEIVGELPVVIFSAAHRWRYARVSTPLGASAIYNDHLALGLCGDWFLGPRVEGAWLSGRALAQLVTA